MREHIFSLENDSETEIANELPKEQIQQLKSVRVTIAGGQPNLIKNSKLIFQIGNISVQEMSALCATLH